MCVFNKKIFCGNTQIEVNTMVLVYRIMASNDSENINRSSGESTTGTTSSFNGNAENEEKKDERMFECNICLDTARDAVVSMCGHLFWYVLLSNFQYNSFYNCINVKNFDIGAKFLGYLSR